MTSLASSTATSSAGRLGDIARYVDPVTRVIDPQALADLAADVAVSPALRSAAMRLLDAGAVEFCHLRLGAAHLTLSRAAYLIVHQQARAGQFSRAAESLSLFAGLDVRDAVRLLPQVARLAA